MTAGRQGVVFDLDGVLVRSEHLWEQGWTAYAAGYAVTWTAADTRACQGMSVPEWGRYLADRTSDDPDDATNAVIGSVVELASRTGALVVAEGIERSAQIGPLLRLGITAGQGFYLGRPGPLEQAMVPVITPMTTPAEAINGVAAWRQSIGLPIS